VTTYALYVDDGFGVTFTKVFEYDYTEFLVKNLTAGISYSFYVTASNFNGEGPRSDIIKIKSCIPPFNVRAPVLV